VIPAGNEPSGCASIHLANAAGVLASREDFSGGFRHRVADFPAVHKLFVEKDMISAFFEKRKEVF
jgi:hypothetical protein